MFGKRSSQMALQTLHLMLEIKLIRESRQSMREGLGVDNQSATISPIIDICSFFPVFFAIVTGITF